MTASRRFFTQFEVLGKIVKINPSISLGFSKGCCADYDRSLSLFPKTSSLRGTPRPHPSRQIEKKTTGVWGPAKKTDGHHVCFSWEGHAMAILGKSWTSSKTWRNRSSWPENDEKVAESYRAAQALEKKSHAASSSAPTVPRKQRLSTMARVDKNAGLRIWPILPKW